MSRRKIVCLTPVRDEEWILEHFLKAASAWADEVIIADQNSTDRSRQIAVSFAKVTLLHNDSTTFNEPERQVKLIDAARKLSDDNLLLALDADEVLFFEQSVEASWEHILSLPAGTCIYFECINVGEGFRECWTKGYHFYGYVDDGTEHKGLVIDSPRLPQSNQSQHIRFEHIKVLHLQYTNMERVRLKQYWYQCLEATLANERTYLGTKKTNLYIFERYNKFRFALPQRRPISPCWLSFLEENGFTATLKPQIDTGIFYLSDIRGFFDRYGTNYFQHLSIWDHDWSAQFGSERYVDPRRIHTRLIHRWLMNRPLLSFSRWELLFVRLLETLRLF